MSRNSIPAALLACVVAACGRYDFDVIPPDAEDAEIVVDRCAVPGACDEVVTANISCTRGTTSSDTICLEAGLGPALASWGYSWFQCGGPISINGQPACPNGWPYDDLACPTWCAGSDCVGVPYCGAGQIVHEKRALGSTTFDPVENGYNCSGYNPGWVVRIRCVDKPMQIPTL